MPKPFHIRQSEYGGAVARNFVIIAVVLIVVALVLFTGKRIKELNRELAASEQRAEEMNERLREYSEQLETTIGKVRQARDRADNAEAQVAETTEELEATQEQVGAVTAEREQARAQTAETLEELEAIQRRRAAELDRMQQALNKVAPTKRTPAGMVMILSDSNFRFAFDKSNISTGNREILSRIAGILLASEGYRLFVDGHTDDQGDASYNEGLSMRRATSVRDYLVGAGLPGSVIEVHGYGKRQPLVKAKTKDGRAANRRVEIGIVDTIVHYEKRVKN
jgi:outer membrane protein OmpA-like peptidoglycan-associated protein